MSTSEFEPETKETAPLTMEDLAPLEAVIPVGYPEMLKEFAFIVFSYLVTQDVLPGTREQWAACAFGTAEKISMELGGSQPYIPAGAKFRRSRRNPEIKHDFRGNNFQQIARTYGLTESRVRQIVRA